MKTENSEDFFRSLLPRQFFNPYHDRSSGRFTSRTGGFSAGPGQTTRSTPEQSSLQVQRIKAAYLSLEKGYKTAVELKAAFEAKHKLTWVSGNDNSPLAKSRLELIDKANAALGRLEEMKAAYFAVDKTAFLQQGAIARDVKTKLKAVRREISGLQESLGLNYGIHSQLWSAGGGSFDDPDVALKKSERQLGSEKFKALKSRVESLASEEMRLTLEMHAATHRQEMAYVGSPTDLVKPPAKPVGTIGPEVPTSLPRGGAPPELRDLLNSGDVVMRIREAGLEKVLSSGTFRSGLAPGTNGVASRAGSQKKSYNAGRINIEEKVFGVPGSAPPSTRPIYAIIDHPDTAKTFGVGSMVDAFGYGNIQVVFKNEVKSRGTFTIGDSMTGGGSRRVPASPVWDPAPFGLRLSDGSTTASFVDGKGLKAQDYSFETQYDTGSKHRVFGDYIETQIHGGAKLSEVREIRLPLGSIPLSPAALKKIKAAGITVTQLPPTRQYLMKAIEMGLPVEGLAPPGKIYDPPS